jgi:hypothetical protein
VRFSQATEKTEYSHDNPHCEANEAIGLSDVIVRQQDWFLYIQSRDFFADLLIFNICHQEKTTG